MEDPPLFLIFDLYIDQTMFRSTCRNRINPKMVPMNQLILLKAQAVDLRVKGFFSNE